MRPPSRHTENPTINHALLMWLLLILLGAVAVIIGVTVGLMTVIRLGIYLPIQRIKLLYDNFREFRIWIRRRR